MLLMFAHLLAVPPRPRPASEAPPRSVRLRGSPSRRGSSGRPWQRPFSLNLVEDVEVKGKPITAIEKALCSVAKETGAFSQVCFFFFRSGCVLVPKQRGSSAPLLHASQMGCRFGESASLRSRGDLPQETAAQVGTVVPRSKISTGRAGARGFTLGSAGAA